MQKVDFIDMGLVDFKECWDFQEVLMKEVIDIKLKNRELPEGSKLSTKHYLLLCEHPNVYTLGKSGSENNLLINEEGLREHKATFYRINRGGDITYHGPGQLVGYPILDLDMFFNDIHRYMRCLEEVIILTLAAYGINSGRIEKLTGVWLDADDPEKARKICAFGVRLNRWVTMHGWALNVNTDLAYFNSIIPCGIKDKKITSMEKELGKKTDMNAVKESIKKNFAGVFDVELTGSRKNFQILK